MDKYESQHNKEGEKYAALVKALYRQAILEFVQTAQLADFDGDGFFSFDDMPLTKSLVDNIVTELASNVKATIVNGCSSAWNIANKKNDALVDMLFRRKSLTDEQKIRYFQNNEPALKEFIKRRTNGLNLSDKVWKYTNGFKNEIEYAISVSVGSGKSAHDLALEVQQYLQQPDKLFRRVSDEKGDLHLSNNAKNYHPGAGVYRSSYQNAMRLARTEINIAYRTSDYTRIQQLDFIVGIEIKTSGNHPEHDICDQLQGRYPKDFKFVGWHPNCRCYQKTILKTEEEMERDEERMRKGGEPSAKSENTVNDVPDEFKEWVYSNEIKIKKSKSTPYFVKDNIKTVKEIMNTPKTIRNLSKTIEKYELSPFYGVTAKTYKLEIEKAMNELFRNNDFGMLIKSENLNAVLHSHFKNQFETGKSGGVLYSHSTIGKIEVRDKYGTLNSRLKRSHEMFGISDTNDKSLDEKQLKRNEYEKYGLLLNHDKSAENLYTKDTPPDCGYGTIEVRFKKDKVKTTWTPQDSLCSITQPSLTSDPKASSWDDIYNLFEYYKYHKKMPTDYNSYFSENLISSYLELQYHGNLTIDCIDSILFPYRPHNATDMEIIKIAKSKGITVYYRLNGLLSIL